MSLGPFHHSMPPVKSVKVMLNDVLVNLYAQNMSPLTAG